MKYPRGREIHSADLEISAVPDAKWGEQTVKQHLALNTG